VTFTLILLVAITLFGAYRTGARTTGGPMLVVCAFMALQMVFRPLILAFGMDTPFLPNPASAMTTGQAVVAALWLVLAWVVAFWVGVALLAPGRVHPLRPAAAGRRDPFTVSDRTLWIATIAFLFIAAAGSLPLIHRAGGFYAFAAARKQSRGTVNFDIRSVGVWAAMLATLLADRMYRRRHWRPMVFALAAALVAGLLTFAWGARDGLILPAVALVLVRLAATQQRRLVLRRLLTAGLALLAIVAVAYELRIARDAGISETRSVEQEATPLRRVSVGVNATMFDALMVARTEWPANQPFVGGVDFTSRVPVLGSRDAGTPTSFNLRLAHVSVPSRRTGTPATAVGDWYVAWGVWGVVFGGLFAGVVISLLERWHARRVAAQPVLATVVITLVCLGVLVGGVTSASLSRTREVVLPLALILLLELGLRQVDRWRRRTPADPDAAIADADVGDDAAVSAATSAG